jgi:hypothetical protein
VWSALTCESWGKVDDDVTRGVRVPFATPHLETAQASFETRICLPVPAKYSLSTPNDGIEKYSRNSEAEPHDLVCEAGRSES